jgi:hypothetical protein
MIEAILLAARYVPFLPAIALKGLKKVRKRSEKDHPETISLKMKKPLASVGWGFLWHVPDGVLAPWQDIVPRKASV